MPTTKNLIRASVFIFISTLLAACDEQYYDEVIVEETVTVTTTYSHGQDRQSTEYYEDPPRLYQFDVIDTYGTNSEFEPEIDLALSPYVNNGYFEIFWDSVSEADYFVELRFNTEPSTNGSRLISSEYCGSGFYCDDNQYQYCEYTPGLALECETSNGEIYGNDIDDMLYTIPQDAYLILQVCDSSFFYCEYETKRVSVE